MVPQGPEQPYRIETIGPVRQRLREWDDLAEARRLHGAYLDCVREMVRRLSADPLGWGEPLYPLRNLGLTVCHAALHMIRVIYAVDDQRRIVYITRLDPMPGGGLGSPF